MRPPPIALAWVLGWSLLNVRCGSSPPPHSATAGKAPASAAPRIAQFYATAPTLPKGEQELICYGVENAVKVTLAPPPQELSAALSRCIEVQPDATTRYTLTVEGSSGPPVTGQLTVNVGPPHVKIIDVTVSSLNVARGSLVSLCYHVQNAESVEIEPIHFRARTSPHACGTDTPRKTTTYVVTAHGAEGSHDQERVTVQVH